MSTQTMFLHVRDNKDYRVRWITVIYLLHNLLEARARGFAFVGKRWDYGK